MHGDATELCRCAARVALVSARQVVAVLLVIAFSMTAAGFLVAIAGDMVAPLPGPGATPSTYGYPGPSGGPR